jgi:hypothetical protein
METNQERMDTNLKEIRAEMMERTEGRIETDQEPVEADMETGVYPRLCAHMPRGDG